jgi:hypothetical protein
MHLPQTSIGTAKAIAPVSRLVKFLIAVVSIIRHVMKSTRMTAAPFRRNCISGSIPLVFSSAREYTLTMGIQRSMTMSTSFKNSLPTVAGEMGSKRAFLMPRIL